MCYKPSPRSLRNSPQRKRDSSNGKCGTIGNVENLQRNCDKPFQNESESVDYIYTDPRTERKSPISICQFMWNAWLDLPVSDQDYELKPSKVENLKRPRKNMRFDRDFDKEMYRVLKFDRWMSFVFNHKDPAYWHIIVNTAEAVGLNMLVLWNKRVAKRVSKNVKILLQFYAAN